jgi:hypothetical protein
MNMMQIASTAKRCEGMYPTLKAWAGPGILIILFVASLAYVVFGGTLALEASPVPEPDVSIAESALITVDAGRAPRIQTVSSGYAKASDYFPSSYVNRGRDGDGNAMTYEHD